MRPHHTPQQLDPIGGITARLIVIVSGVIAVAVAIGMTLMNTAQVSNPALAIVAIVVLALTVAYYIRASSPFHAPLRFGSHVVICLGALIATAIEAASQWGTNAYVRDDWGPIAMAIVVISLGVYRGHLEILACTIGSSFIIGGIAVAIADSGSTVTPVPVAVLVVTMVIPVLGSGFASASFSRTLVRILLAWRNSVDAQVAASGEAAVAPAGHLAFLNTTVIPFLDRVVTTGQLREGDGARARRLAQELRVLMVMDAEQSWLTGVVDRFDDPARVAGELNSAQRGCLRALIAHVQSSDSFAPRTVRVRLGLENGHPAGVLEVDTISGATPRAQVGPYIAVARHVFAHADAVFTPGGFALTFRI